MTIRTAAAAGLLACLSCPAGIAAAAEPIAEHPDAVPLFTATCLTGGLTVAAREAAIAADGGWTADAAPDVDVPALGASRAIDVNFDYSKPTSVRQWSRTLDGVRVRAVLATFPEKRRYPNLCALIVPGVKNAFAYDDAFALSVKALGLKGKSTDLPHYFEYSGKIDGGHPVRAEIFARTRSVPEKDSMHLYVAF